MDSKCTLPIRRDIVARTDVGEHGIGGSFTADTPFDHRDNNDVRLVGQYNRLIAGLGARRQPYVRVGGVSERAFTSGGNMRIPDVVPWPRTIVHDTRREGIRLGLIVGTITWLWVAVVDLTAGRPFHTFTVLGGLLAFTATHYLLNVTYGVVLLSAIHAAERAPSLIIAVLFGVVTLEGAFAMFTNILAQTTLGHAAWVGIVGGSLIGTGVALALLTRTHPLGAHLRRAEEEM
jgi:hypothetical protein